MRLLRLPTALALICGALGASGHANAQQSTNDEDTSFDALFVELMEKLRPLADAAGITSSQMDAMMTPLIDTALPERADDGKTWGFSMKFESRQTVNDATTPLEPQADGWVVVTTSDECAAQFGGGDVVSFRRIQVGTLRGFQCLQASVDDEAGGLISRSLVEGPDRRFEATYQTALAVADEPTETRLLTERMIEQNVGLATAITALGIKGLERAEAPITQAEHSGD